MGQAGHLPAGAIGVDTIIQLGDFGYWTHGLLCDDYYTLTMS
jgi:hypothetical protein